MAKKYKDRERKKLSVFFCILSIVYGIVFFEPVCAKNLPLPDAKPLQNGFTFLCTKPRVCVYRGHQNGRVLVVFGLLCCQAVYVDVDISRDGDVMRIVDQHDLAGEVSAFALVYFKMQFLKIKKSNLHKRLCGGRDVVPRRDKLLRVDGLV